MQVKFKYILIITAVILFFVGGLIWYVTYLNGEIRAKENTIAVQRQNSAALAGYISMQADSLQDYAISVTDLTTENDNLDKKYVLLRNRYYILLDSVKVLNESALVDTSGNTIVVSFEGREGKVTYKGKTTYFKLTAEGTYSIQIGIEPSEVSSEVYLDKESNLIRNKIYIDGALIDSARTDIDSTLYLLIRNNELDRPDELGFFDNLHFLLGTSLNIVREDAIYVPKKFSLSVGTEYQFNKYRIFGRFDMINQEINVGIQYHPSVKDIWKAIF
jgi:hypothetical protein